MFRAHSRTLERRGGDGGRWITIFELWHIEVITTCAEPEGPVVTPCSGLQSFTETFMELLHVKKLTLIYTFKN